MTYPYIAFKMPYELSASRSFCILAIVVGCFAVLLPNIFFPMLKTSILGVYVDESNAHYRQERSPYLQSNTLHPAFRERGRAVPQPHGMSKVQRERGNPPVPIISAQKPPIPGMRPPIGGAGHVPSQKGTGPMGILMPLYTIGIVIFFGYTIMKLICKKSENPANNLAHDPEFCRLVFNNNMSENKSCKNEKSNNFSTDTSSKLGDIEINQLRKRLAETEATMERIVKQMSLVSRSLSNPLNENTNSCSKKLVELTDDQTSLNVELEKNKKSEDELSNINNSSEIVEQVSGVIEVIGMELNESCENGRPWKCSTQLEDGITPPPEITPQEIILPTNVPPNSQIFVSDAHTENVATQSSVILESKVTLNVISPELNNEIIDANELSNEDDVNEDDTKYENGVLKLESHQTNGNIKNNGTVSEESDEDEDIILRNGIKEFSKYEPDTSF